MLQGNRWVLFLMMHGISFAWIEVYFTPRDDIKFHLIQLIQEERTSIHAAVYMMTDKAIAQALVEAYVRGVKIYMVLDQISMGEKYGKGIFLKDHGVMITVHQPSFTSLYCAPIMHHKFFVFGFNTRMQTSLAWTGSFNCTASASRLHDENVIVTDDAKVIFAYKECFKQLLFRLSGSRFYGDFEDTDLELNI